MRTTLACMLMCLTLTGCQLVADFDRSKIEDPDAGHQSDAAVDAGAEDAGTDSGPDEDAGSDEDAGN